MLPGLYKSESETYRSQRMDLLQAEIALRDQRENVARMRRALPQDTIVENYGFDEGPADLSEDGPVTKTSLSDLLDEGKTVVLYNYMFGEAQTKACPMCTMWCDGLDAVGPQLAKSVTFALVAAAPIADFRTIAKTFGWKNTRLLSSAGTSFKTDFSFQTPEGGQLPGFSVFKRGEDGSIVHTYSGSALMGEGEFRGLDMLTPVWNLLDLTPEGRGDWMPSYDS